MGLVAFITAAVVIGRITGHLHTDAASTTTVRGLDRCPSRRLIPTIPS
jgi:hypothetical protein